MAETNAHGRGGCTASSLNECVLQLTPCARGQHEALSVWSTMSQVVIHSLQHSEINTLVRSCDDPDDSTHGCLRLSVID